MHRVLMYSGQMALMAKHSAEVYCIVTVFIVCFNKVNVLHSFFQYTLVIHCLLS